MRANSLRLNQTCRLVRRLASTSGRQSRNRNGGGGGGGLPGFVVPLVGVVGLSGAGYYLSTLETLPWPLSVVVNSVSDVLEPDQDNLLDSKMQGMPKRTLIIGFEGTLVTKTWSRRYGWRTVKRPGLDSFLLQLQPYYEVVLFTDESNAIAETTVNRLDKFNLFHRKLYRDATTRVDGRLRKDLERLNRDLSDVVVVDCDPEQALYCQRRNGIAIEPFTDPENRDDDALLTLLPLLKEIATQPAADARDILSFFAGRNATDGAVDAEGATEESITPYPAATLVKNHATTLASKSAQAKRGLRGVLDLPADDAVAAGEAPMMLPANAPAVQDDEMPSLSQLGGIAKSVLMGEEVAPLAPKAAPGVGRRKKARASRAPTYWEKMHQEEKTVREEEEAKMMAEMKG